MRGNRFSEDDDTKSTYSDAIMSLMMIRFVILALVLVFMSPTQEQKKSSTSERGALRIEATWESNKDVDVDLWCQAPGDGGPVGWNRRGGNTLDLVRDDLGSKTDPHYEITYGRTTPDGEYVVNLHLYANRERGYDRVPVVITVHLLAEDGKGASVVIFRGTAVLSRVGEEVTVIRFRMEKGKIVPGSFSTVYRPLYFAGRN